MLVDSHCHLYLNGLKEDLPHIIERAKGEGVDTLICVGIDLASSRECIRLAEKYPEVFAAVGVHPNYVQEAPEDYLRQLEALLAHPRVVAVGEIGLDYYREYSPHEVQQRFFREQVALAQAFHRPYLFHNRSADKDIIHCLSAAGYFRGVAHCFSSDLATAQQFVEWGLMISFAGNITYKKSTLPEIAKEIPLQQLLVETDAPFLSPVPFRGQTNEPKNLYRVIDILNQYTKIPSESLRQQTRENAIRFFSLSLP